MKAIRNISACKINIVSLLKGLTGGAFALLCFTAGWLTIYNSREGNLFVSTQSIQNSTDYQTIEIKNNIQHNLNPSSVFRGIASKENQMEVSPALLVSQGPLQQEKQKALTVASRVKDNGNEIVFYLGHLLLQSQGRSAVLACNKYQTVDITFEAKGVSFHGHTPKLVMKAPCSPFTKANPRQIGPFIVPKSQILSSPTSKEIFKSKGAVLSFTHVSVQWPETWSLSQLRFIRQTPREDFTVYFTSNNEEDYLTFRLR